MTSWRVACFAESESFLKVLELIGRFWLAVREYERAFDTDQIALQEQRGDVAEPPARW